MWNECLKIEQKKCLTFEKLSILHVSTSISFIKKTVIMKIKVRFHRIEKDSIWMLSLILNLKLKPEIYLKLKSLLYFSNFEVPSIPCKYICK